MEIGEPCLACQILVQLNSVSQLDERCNQLQLVKRPHCIINTLHGRNEPGSLALLCHSVCSKVHMYL